MDARVSFSRTPTDPPAEIHPSKKKAKKKEPIEGSFSREKINLSGYYHLI
jgi:hypothetical protein